MGPKPPKKPRLRKTAPTLREQVEIAKSGNIKRHRFKSAALKVIAPVKKIHLPDNRFTIVVRKAGQLLRRVLGWLIPRYFINSWREVRQVTWPNRKETWRLTGAVFVFAVVFGAMIAAVDWGLDELFKRLVLR